MAGLGTIMRGILKKVTPKMNIHAIKCIINTFPALASTVVTNKRTCDLRIKHIIAKTSLKLAVFYPCCHNFTFFRFIYAKFLIVAYFIRSIQKTSTQKISVLQTVRFVAYDAILPSNIAA